MAQCFYLDESGDLGWSFDRPYRQGGSSRYLTIASVSTPSKKKHLPKRLVRKLYEKFKWRPTDETKWGQMKSQEREEFARRSARLVDQHPDIRLLAITVHKPSVQSHIRNDANKLYNYMIKLSLLDEMACHDRVSFMPDERAVKVKSGNSLHDYLQTQLWFEKATTTQLTTVPCSSDRVMCIQFADMLAGLVQGHYEDSSTRNWSILGRHIQHRRLFFPSAV